MKWLLQILIIYLSCISFCHAQSLSINKIWDVNSGHFENFFNSSFSPLVVDFNNLDTITLPSFDIKYEIGTSNFQKINSSYYQKYKGLKMALKFNRQTVVYPLNSSFIASNDFSSRFVYSAESKFLFDSEISFYNQSKSEYGYMLDPDTIFPTQSLEIKFFESLLGNSSSYFENSFIRFNPGIRLGKKHALFLKGAYSQRRRNFIASSFTDVNSFNILKDSNYTHDSYKNFIYEYGLSHTFSGREFRINTDLSRVLLEYRNTDNNLNSFAYRFNFNVQLNQLDFKFNYTTLGLLSSNIVFQDSLGKKLHTTIDISYSNKKATPWLRNYTSNHIRWLEEDFTQENIGLKWELSHPKLPSFNASMNYYPRNVYLSQSRKFIVAENDWKLSFSLSDTVKLKEFKLMGENRLTLLNKNSGIRYPLLVSNSWLSYSFKIFKKKLQLDPAIGINYFSSYQTTWTDPITGYQLWTDQEIGNYPFLNFKLQAKIEEVYFGLKVTHINEYTMGAHYLEYQTPGMNRLFIGFLRWKLIN